MATETFSTYFIGTPFGTTPLAGTEPVLVFQGGVTKQVPASALSGAATLRANSSQTSGFSANQFVYSDGSLIQAATLGTGLSLAGGSLSVTVTPAGSAGSLQFNSSGHFGGDTGLVYTSPGQVTYALGTITANAKAVNITGTWNNGATTFDAPLFFNITNTASAVASCLFDFQVGGAQDFILQHKSGSPSFPVLSLGPGVGSVTGNNIASAFYNYLSVDNLANPSTYERGMFKWVNITGLFDSGAGNPNTLVIGSQNNNPATTASGCVLFSHDRQGRFAFGFWNETGGAGVFHAMDAGEGFVTYANNAMIGFSSSNNVFQVQSPNGETPDAFHSRETVGIVCWSDYADSSQPFAHRVYNKRSDTTAQSDPFNIAATGYERAEVGFVKLSNVFTISTSFANGTQVAAGVNRDIAMLPAGTEVMRFIAATSNIKFSNAASFSANGSVATVLGSIGPVGSHTTVQTWLTFVDSGGTTRYVPCF